MGINDQVKHMIAIEDWSYILKLTSPAPNVLSEALRTYKISKSPVFKFSSFNLTLSCFLHMNQLIILTSFSLCGLPYQSTVPLKDELDNLYMSTKVMILLLVVLIFEFRSNRDCMFQGFSEFQLKISYHARTTKIRWSREGMGLKSVAYPLYILPREVPRQYGYNREEVGGY